MVREQKRKLWYLYLERCRQPGWKVCVEMGLRPCFSTTIESVARVYFFKNRNFRLPALSSPAPILRWKSQVQGWRIEVMGVTVPSFCAGRKYPGLCPGPQEVPWGDSFTCPLPPHFSGHAFLATDGLCLHWLHFKRYSGRLGPLTL